MVLQSIVRASSRVRAAGVRPFHTSLVPAIAHILPGHGPRPSQGNASNANYENPGDPQDYRRYHSSATVLFAHRTTKDQAWQQVSKQRRVEKGPNKGVGNCAEKSMLPLLEVSKATAAGISHQRRSFSTSIPRSSAKEAHTAESYFKDVDRAPPPSEKTYQVDATNPTVQRPNEALSGEYSRAGPATKEYATVDNNGKYDVPPSTGPEKDQKLRYGSTQPYYDPQSSGANVSKPDEGPGGASAGGRKPEGRS